MPRGERWLLLGRISSALLLAALALLGDDAFSSAKLLLIAAGCAGAVAALGWVGRREQHLLAPLFLADIGWVSVAVVGAGRPDAGLGLLFALVAFASGMWMGGRLALAVSLAAGLALMATVDGVPDLRVGPSWVMIQGLLILVLGAASDSTRTHLVNQRDALARASQALERMRLDTDTIVEHLDSGVLSVDSEGTLVLANRMAARTLGLEGTMLRGRKFGEVLPPGTEALAALLDRGLSGEPVRRAEVDVFRSGTVVPLGVGTTVFAGPDRKTRGVVALFQDLTDIRRRETIERRRDRLAAVGELAAGIAHEIRNSVLPISGSVQMLAQELDLADEQARLFEVVEREMDNIERFVSDLLSYTRSRELKPGPVDLSLIAREAAQDAKLGPGEEPVIRTEGEPVEALADEDQLRQAVRNLVMNAVDATGPGGRVTVRTGRDDAGNPWVEVEDDGTGVPAAERGRIFEAFYTSKPGGTGLGLAIVSRIVEEHEGRIELEDGKGGGARFRIVLNAAGKGRVAARPAA